VAPLNADQQAIADDMAHQITTVFRDSMSWEKLEPVMVRIYRKSLTESEVKGMTTFYSSPAGRAVINKLPIVMQNTMQEMQGMMQEMMPKVQAVLRDSQKKIAAAGSKDGNK
jgi:hypothetical protein